MGARARVGFANESGRPEGQPSCIETGGVLAAFAVPVSVVVFLMDLLGGFVLLLINLLPLLLIERTAVRRAVVVHLLVDVCLGPLGTSCFTGRHLPVTDSVRDALLLIRLAFVHCRVCCEPWAIRMIVERAD
jgi:hypothetical protein